MKLGVRAEAVRSGIKALDSRVICAAESGPLEPSERSQEVAGPLGALSGQDFAWPGPANLPTHCSPDGDTI